MVRRRKPRTINTKMLKTFTQRGILVLVLLCITGLLSACSNSSEEEGYVPNPAEFTTALWDDLLGGDAPLTDATWSALSDLSRSDLSSEDARSVAELAKAINTAEQTGVGQNQWADYFTGAPATCSSITNLASSPFKLPVSGENTREYAKALIVWVGDCNPVEPAQDGGGQSVDYVYAQKVDGKWQPVREWQIPGSSISGSGDAAATPIPASWEMKNFSECGNKNNKEFSNLIIVVNAFEELCQAAQRENINLELRAGFKTPAEQADLFEQALKFYGSDSEARRWVAFSDGNVCASRYCAGVAFGIENDSDALEWLNRVVGCTLEGNFTLAVNNTCSAGSTSITQAARYGFVAPAPNIPTYFEYALPVTSSENLEASASCQPAASTSIPSMIGQIFRCRLGTAGIAGEEQRKIVAEALTVARCESGWSSGAKALGGRYTNDPYPLTGQFYSQAGVFMLSQSVAQKYVPGGYGAVNDPVANINGAASLWLSGQSWGPWPCATGAASPFENGPVLPQFGGGELPEYAYQY